MAKRFTDSEKWRDEWWGSLPNDYRMIWLYLVDSCSAAGIWKKDLRGLNFNCNTQITEDDLKKVFSSRLIDRGNFFFIPKFLRFQYPKGLNSSKPVIISIRKELQLHNLYSIVKQSLGNDFLIVKDKDKDKEKDKEEEKGKEITPANFKQNFKMAFDEITLETYMMQFSAIDVSNELQIFELKCNAHPDDYHARDVPGLRLAFLHQLKNSKGSKQKVAALVNLKDL